MAVMTTSLAIVLGDRNSSPVQPCTVSLFHIMLRGNAENDIQRNFLQAGCQEIFCTWEQVYKFPPTFCPQAPAS